MDVVYRVLKASRELPYIPVRDWHKHVKAAIDQEDDHAQTD